jgi:hypothetical protein
MNLSTYNLILTLLCLFSVIVRIYVVDCRLFLITFAFFET